MKIFYVTFKSQDEARDIGRALVERSLAVGCNWFQTACIYRSAGTVVEER